jgi:heptosyltransferase-2
LFQSAGFIDDVLISDETGPLSIYKQSREWKNGSFDLSLLFTNSFATALVPVLARVPIRIGYATEHRSALLTNPLPLPEWRNSRHEVYYYLNLVDEVRRLVGKQAITGAIDGSLEIAPTHAKVARELLKDNEVIEERPLIALCPGSINSRAKRWPADRYASLADRIIEELDANCLLIGSPGELDVSLDVASRMINKPVMLTGKTSLAQLIGVLSQVDLLITNDTGPAHIASALSRPTLIIFGPTNPLTTRPFGDAAELLQRPPDCAPCMLRDCPIDHRCMTAISVDEVFRRAQTMLGQRWSHKIQLAGY